MQVEAEEGSVYATGVSPGFHPSGVVSHLRRLLWLGAFALAGVGATFGGLYWARAEREAWVLHSREVSRLGRKAIALATDRETGIRGYLLSHDERSLEPDRNARRFLPSTLDSLVALTADKPVQQERARVLRGTVDRWDREFAQPAVTPNRSAQSDLLAHHLLSGKGLFDEVRRAFLVFTASEDALYAEGVRREAAMERIALGVVLAEIVLLAGILGVLGRRILAQARQVVEQQHGLQAQNALLAEQKELLEDQAVELELQTAEAEHTAERLEQTNEDLNGALATADDARRTAESATREHAATLMLLDVVLESAPVGFALFDLDRRYLRINSALAASIGRPASEYPGKRVHDVAPTLADAVEGALRHVMTTGEPVFNVEHVQASKTTHGKARHLLASYYPVCLADGQLAGVGVMVVDTTDRKGLEEQLLQAQKMEAVGQLAGGVAHDFNNLLTIILSYTDLLLPTLDQHDPRREDVAEVKQAAIRATQLTRQLLAFSRKQVIEPRPLKLNTVVTEMEKMLRRLIGEDVALETSLAADLYEVHADQGQIEQVVMNLAINARDAMADGGRLMLETANVVLSDSYATQHVGVAPGEYVMIAVSDTGTGMPPEIIERIFEPFFTTKEVGRGTGLGLSTVYGIVKQAGGDVWVYSEPGEGTTFKIYLPRLTALETQAAAPAVASADGRGHETLLLVEDDERLRVLALRVLQSSGYAVLAASNGAEALRRAAEHEGTIHLVLSDVVMPGMSGRVLSEQLTATRPSLKLLFMSGYTNDDVMRRGIVERRMAFLQKPFTPEQLVGKVREVLDAA